MKTRAKRGAAKAFGLMTVLWLLRAQAPAVVLNVPEHPQEMDQWCWASTSQMVLEFYETYVSQPEIAQYGTGGSNTWNFIYGWGTDTNNITRYGVDYILGHFDNIATLTYAQALSLNTVRREIDTNGRPFVLRWAWQSGGGHILVAYGLVNSNVYIRDPLNETTMNSYDWVCTNSDHTWTHSLTLTTAPPVISVSPANLDFGQVEVGVTVGADLSITTNGRRSGTFSGTLTGLTAPFYIGGNGSFTVWPPFGTWVPVNYQPTAAGSYTQTLTLKVSSATPVWRRVSGRAYVPAFGLGESLDLAKWAWNLSGSPYWHGQSAITHDGVDAAQSGAITNGQVCYLSANVTGPGILSFWWKVSSETNKDELHFGSATIDEQISGEVDWQYKSFLLPWGRQGLTWYYAKDSNGSAGHDAAWLDEVTWQPLQMIIPWGGNSAGQTNLPAGLTNVAAVAAGHAHGLALRQDGTVVAWGSNDSGQTNVPLGLKSVLAIAAGYSHSLALTESGKIVGWGLGTSGQTNSPATAVNATAIAAGESHSLALRSDGTVVAWGGNNLSQTNVPASTTGVFAIAAGRNHSLAIKGKGQVVAWGDDGSQQCDVPASLTNAIAVSAGDTHSMALRSDSTVVVWGGGMFSSWLAVPAGLTNVVAIAAGGLHCLALRADSTVVAWGWYASGQTNVPTGLTNVLAIAGGGLFSLALVRGDFPDLTLRLFNPVCAANKFSAWVTSYAGKTYNLEYKNSLEDADWTALASVRGYGQGLQRTLSDSTLNPTKRFYRVRQQ